ncbi:MAG: hypothetical protein H7282_03560 [Cytophagaceae bacterium]|nr:hypothetical protein [Cytophagaceae bacterium]
MKKFLFITFLLIAISITICYYYFIILGGPVKKNMTINGCTVDYTYFITNNKYQIEKTHGHAYGNAIELFVANTEIASCLCESYLNKRNTPDSTALIDILNSKEYLDSKRYINNIGSFSTDTIKIESVCNDKDNYFGILLMD